MFSAARIDGAPPLSGRDRQILSALVVARSGCTVDQLAAALYGDDLPQTWRKVVQGSISRLRKLLGPLAVETTATGYRLGLGDEEIDVRRFEQLVDQAEVLAGSGEPDRAVVALREGLALAEGEPFADLDRWESARAEAARLGDLQRVAEERLVDALLATGQVGRAAALALAHVEREPFREQRWAALALAQYRSGRQGEALRSLGRARRVLADELGLEPGPELVALEQRILAQDPALQAAGEVVLPASATCPYKGLRSYGVDDAETFFGREDAVAEALHRLGSSPFLAVVGPSGCGKSSLARAGLGPALRRTDRHVTVITPGARPVAALEGVGPGDVLVVDQLEELFGPAVTGADREAFAAALEARAGITVVTLRADHLASVVQAPALTRLIESGLFLLGPMDEADLRAAIEGPATRAGLRLEPGLVDLVVRDVVGQPGALPLLSHALAEVWARREGRVLTIAAYREVGGVQGAVGRTAESAIDALGPEGRRIARDLFLRLVAVADGEPVRVRLARTDVTDDPSHAEVLEALAQARLLTVDDVSVQVAHEALARAWPRLQTWLDEDGEGQRLRRHLTAAAASWSVAGEDPDELYRGARLRSVQEWVAASDPALTPGEVHFLEASGRQARRDEADLAQRATEQARVNRRQGRLLRLAALALVAALVATGLAVSQGNRADRERQTAEGRSQDLALQEVVARADTLQGTKRDLAALLAVAAHRMDPTTETYSGLLRTFTAAPNYERTVPLDLAGMDDAVASGDGRRIFATTADDSVVEVDLGTGATREVLAARSPAVDTSAQLAAPPDGSALARLLPLDPERAELVVVDADTGEERFAPVAIGTGAAAVAFSPDGALVAVGGGFSGLTEIRSAIDGSLVRTVAGRPRPLTAVYQFNTVGLAFLDIGRLAITTQSGDLRVVDPRTGRDLQSLAGPVEAASGAVATDPDGSAVYGHSAGGMAAWDLDTGRLRWSRTADGECNSLAVAPSLDVLLCGSESGRVRAYDLATGVRVARDLDYQFGPVRQLAVTADGSRLLEVGRRAVSVWRLDGGGAIADLIVPGGSVPLEYEAGGDLLVRRGYDPTDDIALVDATDGHVVDPLDGIVAAVPTHRPGILGVSYPDGSARWYDSERQRPLPQSGEGGATFAPTGAVAIDDRLVVWDDQHIQGVDDQGRRVDPATTVEETFRWLTISDDGSRFFTLQGLDLVPRTPSGEPTGQPPVPDVMEAETNSEVVVVATVDLDLQVLDAETLEPSGRAFPGLNSLTGLVRFADDEQRLLVVNADRSIRLADLPSRSYLGGPIELGSYSSPDAAVRLDVQAAIRGDGEQLAVGTVHGIVVWDLDAELLAEAACRVAGRDITEQEWEDHLAALGPYRPVCPDV